MSKELKCCCQACEVKIFKSFKARVLDLTDTELQASYEAGSRGMDLIEDLHAQVAKRHPLGIGQILHAVMTSIHIGERRAAVSDLDQLIDDELQSARINDVKLDAQCRIGTAVTPYEKA